MTKAFAYLRVSGKGQVDGDGFERQLAAIKAYAKANDIAIVSVFREEGVSGTTELDNRPALDKLIKALAANGTRTVIIEKLDRLARDIIVQEMLIKELRKGGFTLISVEEPDIMAHDASRKLIRQIFGVIAEYEKDMIVSKLRSARRRIREREGRCEGRKPYGTRLGESSIIAKVRDWRTLGWAWDRIAIELNACGLPSRSGKPWRGSTVRTILTRQ